MQTFLKEVSDQSRRMILSELVTGPKTVGQLALSAGLKQPNVSNHLIRMKERGLVNCRKMGRQVYYFLASSEIVARMNYVLSQHATQSAEPDNLAEIAVGYAKLACMGDESGCCMVIDDLVRRGTCPTMIQHCVLGAAMHSVGDLYESGEIGIAEEHMASSITDRMLSRLMEHTTLPPPTHGRALLACVAGNFHSLGLRMISDQLRLAGWEPLFLGQNVPAATIATTAQKFLPRVVLLSAATADSMRPLAETIQELREIDPSRTIKIGIGGRAICGCPEVWQKLDADFTASNVEEFCDRVLASLDSECPDQQK